MSDSEVLTLALLGQWRADGSERGYIAWVHRHWSAYFPHLLTQSAFNRRVRDLGGVLQHLGPRLHRLLITEQGEEAAYAVVDAVPVPLMKQCRGERHRLFGVDEATIGRGGSDRGWYYGVSLLDEVSASGSIPGFVIGPANTEGRWLLEALLCWQHDPWAAVPTAEDLEPVLGRCTKPAGRRGPTGRIAGPLTAGQREGVVDLGDGGFDGQYWQQHWQTTYGVNLLTSQVLGARVAEQTRRDVAAREQAAGDGTGTPRTAEPPEQQTTEEETVATGAAKAEEAEEERAAAVARAVATARRTAQRWHASHRQIVETVHNRLIQTFHLTFPKARTYWGLLTRLGAKVAAHNLLVLLNYRFGREPFAVFNPLD